MPSQPTWLFGYGSLLWRPAFPFAARRPAAIHGWRRVFWQASPDHRGTPEQPGRVATLIEEPGGITWGMAYQLPEVGVEEILAALGHRERAGYLHHRVRIQLLRGPLVDDALIYVAGPDNPNFIGPAAVEEMAAHIARSEGPSGSNLEYVLRLAATLREIGVEDPHVFEIEAALNALRG